jgi:uncharacterized protein YecE (DUF72 family)
MDVPKRAKLWIGPSGWSYDDWNGVVYPVSKPRGFKPLAYLARFFSAVEVNSSFYRIPTARMTAAWVPLVPRDFRFAFKLTQSFTHQRGDSPAQSDAGAFRAALAPIREAGLLGPLLIQFPWSFRFTAESADWLKRLADTFPDFDRCIEVRHSSWGTTEALAELRRAGGYCNIDQPQLHDCLSPTQHVFGETAYVRLHGRNARNWFAGMQPTSATGSHGAAQPTPSTVVRRDAAEQPASPEGARRDAGEETNSDTRVSDAKRIPSFERYNYLYSEDELREWLRRIDAMCAQAEDAYVFANNHYRGQGPANALELRAMLENRHVAVPNELLQTYPRLRAIAQPPREPGLFDAQP